MTILILTCDLCGADAGDDPYHATMNGNGHVHICKKCFDPHQHDVGVLKQQRDELLKALLDERDALTAEVERLKSMTAVTMGVGSGDGNLFVHGDCESIKAAQAIVLERGALRAEVERLQEAVRPRREDECLTLDHWRIRAYHLEENWSRCSRACAIEQDKREQAEARAERLAMALRLAEEHINALTPEWYSAGQRVLAEIRAALTNRSSNRSRSGSIL